MGYEQPELSNTEEDIDNKTEDTTESQDHDPRFDCESCMDREGGCPTCGWGNNM